MFGDVFKAVGGLVGTVAGVALSPIAIALDCSEDVVKQAINSGCSTIEEIKQYIENIG